MKELTFADAPHNWPVCFQTDCPMATTCLRHAVGRLAPADLPHHECVLPAARKDDNCSMFVENTPVQLAWGMKNLFYNVQPYDFPRMRHELEEHFGSHSTYYRYWNGQRTITPDDQSWITALFNRYGYEKPGPYNRTTIAYHFPI